MKKIISLIIFIFFGFIHSSYALIIDDSPPQQTLLNKYSIFSEMRTPYTYQARDYFISMARNNDVIAQTMLGIMLYEGDGLTRSQSEAKQWFRLAAEQGNPTALYYLGRYVQYNNSYQQSEPSAIYYYQQAAEKGNLAAQDALIDIYRKGELVKKDTAKALALVQQYANAGNRESQYQLAMAYLDGKELAQDYTLAFAWFEKSAKQNHRLAQYRLGNSYHFGQGIKQDDKAAFYWYKQATKQGVEAASFYLGYFLENGIIVPRNIELAKKYYFYAADERYIDGIAEAQYRLGLILLNQNDDVSAFFWLSQAALGGYADAQYQLGLLFYQGRAVLQNNQEAQKWWDLAAKFGNQDAITALQNINNQQAAIIDSHLLQDPYLNKKYSYIAMMQTAEQNIKSPDIQFLLGQIYSGPQKYNDYATFDEDHAQLNITPNAYEGLKWYNIAAMQNNKQAIFTLAKIYRNGSDELPTKFTNTFYWTEKAANLGITDAQAQFAQLYLDGIGTSANVEKAVYWLEKLAETKPGMGFYKLAKLYSDNYYTNFDSDKELYYLLKSANAGYADAQYELGNDYYYGYQYKQDVQEGLKWLRLAANNDSAKAKIILAQYNEPTSDDEANYANVFEYAKQQAEKGDKYALTILGLIYRGLEGIEADRDLEFALYLQAAKLNSPLATTLVGFHYYDQGVVKKEDAKKAYKYFSEAAKLGSADAHYYLYNMYINGELIKKDKDLAFQHLKTAIAMGEPYGMDSLMTLDLNGKQDYSESQINLPLFKIMANNGDEEALMVLGFYYYGHDSLYLDGEEENEYLDYALAYKYFSQAAALNNAMAQNMLGEMYKYGYGVEEDQIQALYWFKKSALQGNPHGRYNYGDAFLNGDVLNLDYEEAFKWFSGNTIEARRDTIAKLDEILINLNYLNSESDDEPYSDEPCTDCAE